jgi:hypothetical protein
MLSASSNAPEHEKEEECGLAGHGGLALTQVRILVLLIRREPYCVNQAGCDRPDAVAAGLIAPEAGRAS